MKQTQIFLLPAILAFALTSWAQTPKLAAPTSPQPAPTLASMVDSEITAVEMLVVDVAEAMPEDKYNFSPESLNIPGGDYKGVRTFALQVKHVAASNYFIWYHHRRQAPRQPKRRKRPRGPEDQSRHHQVPERLFRPGTQGRGHVNR
jgi:hypothetical protein